MSKFNIFNKEITSLSPKTRYDKNDSANGFLGGIIAPILMSFVFVFIFAFVAIMAGSDYESILNNPVVIVIMVLLSQAGFCVFLWWYHRRKNISFVKAMKFKKVNILLALVGAVVSVAFLFLSNNFVTMIDGLLRMVGYTKSSALPFDIDSIGNLILSIGVLALVPSVVEELLFRGMVLGGLVDKKSTLGRKILMLFIASLVFACIHQSAQQFVFPLMCGMVFGVVYLFSGNIWYSIIMHFSSNATVVILNYISTINNNGQEVVAQPFEYSVGNILLAIGLLIVGVAIVIGFVFLVKKLAKSNEFMDKTQNDEVEIIKPDEVQSTEETIIEEKAKTVNNVLAKNKFLIAFCLSIFMIVYDLIQYIQ